MKIEDLKKAMDAREEIRSAYYAEWKQAEHESAEAQAVSIDLHTASWQARIARRKAGEETPSAAEKAYDAALEDEARKEARERSARLAYYIAADNAKRATLEYLTAAAVETLRPYTGKPYGPKTEQKISEEHAARTGYRMHISEEYARSIIRFYPAQWTPGPREDMEISYYHAAEGGPAPALVDNKIQETTPETWRPSYCTEYHDDGTPAEIAAAVEAAHAEALKAYSAFETAAAKYNALRPLNTKSISAAANRPYGIF